MAVVLNNTKRNFRAHAYYDAPGGAIRVRTVKVVPGMNTLSTEELELFQKPRDVKQAISRGAIIINANGGDVSPVDHQIISPPKSPMEKRAEEENRIPEVTTKTEAEAETEAEVEKPKKRRRSKKKKDAEFGDFD